MRPILICLLALAGCRGILDIPSEGKVGCPAPCTVTVSGRAVHAESLAASQPALANVTVELTGLDPSQEAVTDASGAYLFSGLKPGTPIAFNLSFRQTDPDVQGLLDTVYVVGSTETANITVDLPAVQYRWLANVAFQCGIFASLDKALYEPGTRNVNTYFTTRATVIGQVLEQDGSPAKLDRGNISAVIDDFRNFHQNPADTSSLPPATLCFLEPDPSTGEYRGMNANQTTSGRFVLFRARNKIGTGSGIGEVRIPGFSPAALDVSSGSIGFVHMQRGDRILLPDRPLTFEGDIYHYFTEKTCNVSCHRPGGIGYEMAPVRPGPNGLTYRADWSGKVDAVFNNLTKPFDTDCALGDDNAARVCQAVPTASLLYQKPGGLLYHSGVDLGTKDEMIVFVLRWIQDGLILR